MSELRVKEFDDVTIMQLFGAQAAEDGKTRTAKELFY